MAMRPVDLQLSILQATQTAAVTQQQLEGPAAAQAATQQRFAAQVAERQESIGTIDEAEFERVRADERERSTPQDGRRRRPGAPRPARQETAAQSDGPGFADDEHLIDFSA